MDLNQRIDGLRDDLIKDTQELLKIKSVLDEAKEGMPFGEGVNEALVCALNISEKLGFKTVNMDGYIGYAEHGEGDDYVAVLGHLDVVPEGDGWAYPPYGAEIHDGRIYARGAIDDKGPTIAALYGLKAIVDSGVKLSKKVRIVFGTNEETGSSELEYYLEREKPPVSGFTPDGNFPVINGEKGITSFRVVKDLEKKNCDTKVKWIKGGTRSNVVPDLCEALIETDRAEEFVNLFEKFKEETEYDISATIKEDGIFIKSVGVAAHGSLPEQGKNAIMQMFALLAKLDVCEDDCFDFIKFFDKNVGMETDGTSFGVGLEDNESGKLSFNVGVVNCDEEKIHLELNLRYPVTFKFDDMMVPFNKKIEGTGIRVEDMRAHDPLFFPEDHELIKILMKVYEEQTGQEGKPLAIGGGTYAKEMPNIVAFGPHFPGMPDYVHQANENIGVDELILNAKIYANAILELAK